MLLLENVGIAIILAVLFRHQAILIENDPLKLRPVWAFSVVISKLSVEFQRTLSVIRAGIFIVFNSSIFAYILFGGSAISAETYQLLEKVQSLWKDNCKRYYCSKIFHGFVSEFVQVHSTLLTIITGWFDCWAALSLWLENAPINSYKYITFVCNSDCISRRGRVFTHVLLTVCSGWFVAIQIYKKNDIRKGKEALQHFVVFERLYSFSLLRLASLQKVNINCVGSVADTTQFHRHSRHSHILRNYIWEQY